MVVSSHFIAKVLDILVDEHESVEIHSQSNVKSIVANVKIQDSRKYDC